MRRALEHDDLLDEEPPSRDLVLGMPALLGIFFALALVCAVCFGWGYSSGHGWRGRAAGTIIASSAPREANAPPPARPGLAHPVPLGGSGAAGASDEDAPAEAFSAPGKPSPGADLAPGPGVEQSTAPTTPTAQNGPQPGHSQPVTPQASTAAEREAEGFPPNYVVPETERPPVAPAAPAAAQRAGIQTEGTSLMVQIAAVSRAADAQTLANALRHDGFAAMVRTSTTDNYFHIQVGPFATLDAAKAMRSRLADNGYNAFVKP